MARLHAAEVGYVYEHSIRGFAAWMSDEDAAAVARDPRVAYVEEDQIVTLERPGAEGKPSRPAPEKPAQTTPWGVDYVGGAGTSTSYHKAWIIDTGIDLDHPDLVVDVSLSKTFVPRTKNADDGNGHGTHVAGTIAAKNDGYFVVGVAPGATVVAVRVLNSQGSGTYSGIIAGVDYVAANAASGDVANLSLGGSAYKSLDDAIVRLAEKRVNVTIAAGNSGANANNYSPARVNGDYIYTISAINSSGCLASWSNYGNPPIDYAAPGVSIPSLWKDGGMNTISGTSMAAPHVAGILLNGSINSSATASCDPDGTADPIARR
jgi:subtilisin family serine protease